jgi:hypothetical protein
MILKNLILNNFRHVQNSLLLRKYLIELFPIAYTTPLLLQNR